MLFIPCPDEMFSNNTHINSEPLIDPEYLGPLWLDQNRKRFQSILCLFGPDFLKPNFDSWNHEASPGGRFIGFKMAESDEQVSMEISDNLFYQCTIHYLTIKQWHFDKIRLHKLINFHILIKTKSRFRICFHETGFGFNILFGYILMISGSGI